MFFEAIFTVFDTIAYHGLRLPTDLSRNLCPSTKVGLKLNCHIIMKRILNIGYISTHAVSKAKSNKNSCFLSKKFWHNKSIAVVDHFEHLPASQTSGQFLNQLLKNKLYKQATNAFVMINVAKLTIF